MENSIHFPNLGLHFENVGQSIYIGNFEIAYYGIIMAVSMLAGLGIAMQVAKKTKQNPDTYFDMGMIAIFSALVGARAYFVIFSWDEFKDDLLSIFNTRQGGLAIYGGVIAAAIAVFIFAKVKKMNFWQLTDTACIGLVLGQIIGRWGNFFNREVFGGYTDNLLAMQLPLSAVRARDVTEELANNLVQINGVDFIQVHPTFLYESLWNIGVLVLLLLATKYIKFKGEVFLLYLMGYGVGRFWIEGIRTDQLLLPGIGLPVSQVLAGLMVIVSLAVFAAKYYHTKKVEGVYNGRTEEEN